VWTLIDEFGFPLAVVCTQLSNEYPLFQEKVRERVSNTKLVAAT
jgi:hypothetical protein